MPVLRIEGVCKRAVTSCYFHPSIENILLSTCYDDQIRIHDITRGEHRLVTSIEHNNQTGKWISPFRAQWDPKSSGTANAWSSFICADMAKALDTYYVQNKSMDRVITKQSMSPMLTSQPAVCAAHPKRNLVCAGNASGKIILYAQTKEVVETVY